MLGRDSKIKISLAAEVLPRSAWPPRKMQRGRRIAISSCLPGFPVPLLPKLKGADMLIKRLGRV